MSNPNKAKGTRFESALRDTLAKFFRGRYGLDPFRPAQAGPQDVGDLVGVAPFAMQAKNYASITDGIREGLAGVEKQRLNAKQPYGVAFVKRPGKGTGQALAVMTVETWARVVLRLNRAEETLAETASPVWLARCLAQAQDDLNDPYPKDN